MAKRKRRTFTPEFKAEVVLEALTGESSQAEVCRRHNLSEDQLSKWKQLVENAASLFGSTDKQSSDVSEKRIAHLEQLERGYNAQTDVERQEQYKEAIRHYDQSIARQPVYGDDYAHRGECWLHLGKWDKAKKDLNDGKERGIDLIDLFCKSYENVAEFKEKTGLTIPPDIAEMLGG